MEKLRRNTLANNVTTNQLSQKFPLRPAITYSQKLKRTQEILESFPFFCN